MFFIKLYKIAKKLAIVCVCVICFLFFFDISPVNIGNFVNYKWIPNNYVKYFTKRIPINFCQFDQFTIFLFGFCFWYTGHDKIPLHCMTNCEGLVVDTYTPSKKQAHLPFPYVRRTMPIWNDYGVRRVYIVCKKKERRRQSTSMSRVRLLWKAYNLGNRAYVMSVTTTKEAYLERRNGKKQEKTNTVEVGVTWCWMSVNVSRAYTYMFNNIRIRTHRRMYRHVYTTLCSLHIFRSVWWFSKPNR